MFLLIFYLLLAIGVSFLCSLLEAGLLSVPRGHIALLVEQKARAGERLAKMKAEIDRPLSAILTLNTVAHTVGAAGVGAQAAIVFGSGWLGLTSAVLTLLILVLSEIIPKTLGSAYAKPLAPFVAWTTHFLILLLYPAVVALEWMNRAIGHHGAQARMSRAELRAIARIGEREGILTASEAHIIGNLLALRDMNVRKIMTPRPVVFALQQDATVNDIVKADDPIRFARIPLYAQTIDELTGLVTRFDLIEAFRTDRGATAIHEFKRPLHAVPEQMKVAQALEQFIEHDSQLFQVVDEFGGTAGIITLEDTIESLLGAEIVDETDTVADMQVLAREVLAAHRRSTAADAQSDDN